MGIASNKLGYNGGRFYSFLDRPVEVDCHFQVQSADTAGLGITGLKGSGVQNVFMHTSQTAGKNNGYLNPNPASGYALIQLANNYNRFGGGSWEIVSPLSGSDVVINSTSLTAGNPYVISAVGHASAGTVTIAPVADVSGSLASTYFYLYDAYGNTFVLYFIVSGVGSAPTGVSGTLVPVAIATGATAANVGTALVNTINNLASGISGVFSFTSSGTTTVTVVSTQTNPYGPLPGKPQDGAIATGFTFAATVYNTNLACWQGVGVPAGIIPAVGVPFIATSSGVSTGGGSTGTVQAPSLSGISGVEIVGDPNNALAPIPMGGSPNVGSWLMVQFLAATSSSVTTLIPTAPANGSVIYMKFLLEAGSILIAGE